MIKLVDLCRTDSNLMLKMNLVLFCLLLLPGLGLRVGVYDLEPYVGADGAGIIPGIIDAIAEDLAVTVEYLDVAGSSGDECLASRACDLTIAYNTLSTRVSYPVLYDRPVAVV